ncbi:uncharacterized protein LOC135813000 [Sycon ciliatum]|uniref:uncharacterized protein LOC135813000 n=1 Tax=Sycon ciliatum TaxID=27933 RepID=UPI0031F719A4
MMQPATSSYFSSAFNQQVVTNGLPGIGRGRGYASPAENTSVFFAGREKRKAKGSRSSSPMESGSAAAAVLYARYPQMKDLGVVERTGPPHEPLFTVVVSVKGRQFRGVAASKKAAKHEACRAALRELHPDGYGQPVEPNSNHAMANGVGHCVDSEAAASCVEILPSENGHANGTIQCNGNGASADFGASAASTGALLPGGRCPFVGSKSWNPARRLRSQLCDMRCPAEVSQKFQKSALMLLNELFGSDVEWGDFETCGPPNKRTFRIILKVKVGGGEIRDFPGESGKKREAKQVASFAALKQLSMEGEEEDFGESEGEGSFNTNLLLASGGSAAAAAAGTAADGVGKPERDDILSGRGVGRPRRMAPRKARKTPLQQLNEMLPNTPFTLIDEVGPATGRFTFAVTVRGQTFHGTGVSKKEASHRAAAQVLQSIYSINFDDMEASSEHSGGRFDDRSGQATPDMLSESGAGAADFGSGGAAAGDRAETPCDEQAQLASGLSQRPSKLHAEVARQSLGKYHELTALIPLTAVGRNIFATIVMHKYPPQPARATSCQSSNGACAGMAGIKEEENDVTCSNKDDEEDDPLPGGFEVVAIGTGTKVIDGNCLSTEGNRVHDCHGEVVARRAFVRYLYRQLELCVESLDTSAAAAASSNNSIFEYVGSSRGFALRDGIDFYMYVSSSPCGDGRVFVAADNCTTRKQDNHPRRISRGLLRYKVEIGEGTLPSGDDHIQTLDGILGGERLRTMSCSDKMLCWNVLGLQGTLLTHFIDPVYVKAIVVGNLYSHEHMKRALTSRSVGAELCGPYAESLQNPPELTHLPIQAIVERRDTARAAIHSFDWTSGDATLEILQGSSGLQVAESAARICKRSFFERFTALRERLASIGLTNLDVLNIKLCDTYRGVKSQAIAHRQAKKALMSHLEKSNGFWMKKPVEVSDFYL